MASLPVPSHADERFPVLDGWRGISILSVMACHMLPLGPKSLQLNDTAGPLGMALFFTLSGFLITMNLEKHRDVPAFFIRRFCRIVPLAWIYLIPVGILLLHFDSKRLIHHLLFATNYTRDVVPHVTSHFWSLCVEVHFYLFVGLAALLTRFRLHLLIPLALVAVLIGRVLGGAQLHTSTHFRVDEILTGSCLAMVWLGRYGDWPRRMLGRGNTWIYLALLVIASHPASGPLNYGRGAIASVLVGHTLLAADQRWRRRLSGPILRYIARISYALYVFHPITMYGWLGSGDTVVQYAKRPLCIALAFLGSHLSTFYYEQWWLDLGKRLTRRRRRAGARPVRETDARDLAVAPEPVPPAAAAGPAGSQAVGTTR